MKIKRDRQFQLGALWALRMFKKCLPFNGYVCDCSADAVYRIDQIIEKVERIKL